MSEEKKQDNFGLEDGDLENVSGGARPIESLDPICLKCKVGRLEEIAVAPVGSVSYSCNNIKCMARYIRESDGTWYSIDF